MSHWPLWCAITSIITSIYSWGLLTWPMRPAILLFLVETILNWTWHCGRKILPREEENIAMFKIEWLNMDRKCKSAPVQNVGVVKVFSQMNYPRLLNIWWCLLSLRYLHLYDDCTWQILPRFNGHVRTWGRFSRRFLSLRAHVEKCYYFLIMTNIILALMPPTFQWFLWPLSNKDLTWTRFISRADFYF